MSPRLPPNRRQAATAETSQQAAPMVKRRERRGRPRHRRRDGEQREAWRGPRRASAARTVMRSATVLSGRIGPSVNGRPPRRDRDRDRRDDNRPSRTWSSSQQPRGKEPDPNSPFAKLLALKEQLEANKERCVSAWTASASTNGCGTRAWCARARPRRRWWTPAWSASTARALPHRAGRCAPATSSPSRSTAPCGCSRSGLCRAPRFRRGRPAPCLRI